MLSAMVIMGHELCFHEQGMELVRFLKRGRGIRYAVGVDAGSRSPLDLQTAIAIHAARAGRQPFLLAYVGHGWHDGWYYGKWDKKTWLKLTYAWLMGQLRQREGPTLILNDTCRSGALNDRLAKEPDIDAGVISAATPKGSAYGRLTRDVVESWRRGGTYVPQRRVRKTRAWWERRTGTAHDRHFFIKPS